MANHAPRIGPNPPMIIHSSLTKHASASEAKSLLSDYLERSKNAPHLHPDAWLYSDGVKYGPKAGPSGGWAMHHLRRIQAGLGGEQLQAESKEDLIQKFGEEHVPRTHGVFAPELLEEEKEVGDDTRVDAVIEESRAKVSGKKAGNDEKKDKKKRKKERKEQEKAAKKVKMDDKDVVAGASNGHDDEWQDKEEYEHEQEILEGDIADRDPANGRQVTSPPVVVKHKKNGKVDVPKGNLTAEDKAARKAAKKARRAEEAKSKG